MGKFTFDHNILLRLLTVGAFALFGLDFCRAAEALLGSADYRPTPERPFGFRGDGTGRFPGATPVTEWSEKEGRNIRWSAAVGSSFSSPILLDKAIVVTAEPNIVLCLNRADGSLLWKIAITPAVITNEIFRAAAADYEAPKDGSGMTAATPLTDGKLIYIVLANGIVQAVDLDGKTQWSAYIDAQQITGYGRSSSPLLIGGKLIVHMTNLYAFDAATGKQLWLNADAPSTYGSPIAMKLDGVELIVTPNGDVVRASDGKILATEIGHATHTSPVTLDGSVYYGENALNAYSLSTTAKGRELWTATITGELFGSPLLHDGIMFTATGKGELYAYDIKGQGELNPLIEARKLFGDSEATAPAAYASLTLAGKHLFFNSNSGDTVVMEATREARQIAKNQLTSGSGASPIFSGGDMFIRTRGKLFCIGRR